MVRDHSYDEVTFGVGACCLIICQSSLPLYLPARQVKWNPFKGSRTSGCPKSRSHQTVLFPPFPPFNLSASWACFPFLGSCDSIDLGNQFVGREKWPSRRASEMRACRCVRIGLSARSLAMHLGRLGSVLLTQARRRTRPGMQACSC